MSRIMYQTLFTAASAYLRGSSKKMIGGAVFNQRAISTSIGSKYVGPTIDMNTDNTLVATMSTSTGFGLDAAPLTGLESIGDEDEDVEAISANQNTANPSGKAKTIVKGQVEMDKRQNTGAAEDIFRSNTLAGLSNKFHDMNRAFDMIRDGVALSPDMEADLAHVYDVTSLKTASAPEIRKAKTRALIEHYQRRPGDNGSTEVQLVLLTEKINYLTFHMTRNKKDKALVLPFTMAIVRRRKLLQYLRRERFRTYQILCRDLEINEDEFWQVGRLPKNKPYYDTERPLYRLDITEAEARQKKRLEAPKSKRVARMITHVTSLTEKNLVKMGVKEAKLTKSERRQANTEKKTDSAPTKA